MMQSNESIQIKVDRIQKAIERIVKVEDAELKEILADYPESKELIKFIELYEKKIAKLLREEKALFVKQVQQYLQSESSENILVQAMLLTVMSDIFAQDDFQEKMESASVDFLTTTCQELTSKIMEAIDTDVMFEVLSQRTVKWIESWSAQLAELMRLSTHETIEKEITQTIQEGEGIEELVVRLKDLPEFDRKRARRVAITEVLTAYSVAQYEGYKQSPSVTGKTWRHSGARKNTPRPTHLAIDGVTIDIDSHFNVGGESALYPRDVSLSGKERINCHCVLSPSVDEKILGLTKEEKEIIRQQALNAMT